MLNEMARGPAELVGKVRSATREIASAGVRNREELDRRLVDVETLVLELVHLADIDRHECRLPREFGLGPGLGLGLDPNRSKPLWRGTRPLR